MDLKSKSYRPQVGQVKISDAFWSGYLKNIREVMLPYVLDKFEEIGYAENLISVAEGRRGCHNGPPFADGLLFEAMRGASDLLADEYDAELDGRLDRLVALTRAASDATEDGYLNTHILLECPQCRWGECGGDLVKYHDFYNQGALVEAGVSHYLATGKTELLYSAVRAANNICKNVGEPPKRGVIPGHSLPEEAFVKLYRLFRDHRELDGLAAEWGVEYDEYLRVADFWYAARGKYTPEKGNMTPRIHYMSPEYYQNHLPFAEQRYATGHAVRAPLCYLGAAAVAFETENEGYLAALEAIWENVTKKNMHITGGIGARHEIEAFDYDYILPNDAYLETCAAVGLAFWAGEMSLLSPHAMYFDVFERALYNNVLSSIGADFKTYFYQNPLENGDGHHRWEWHSCPCCPPMLLKIFSSLSSYIYSYRVDRHGRPSVFVNTYIGSETELCGAKIVQKDRTFRIDSCGHRLGVSFRIPEYAKDFKLILNGRSIPFIMRHQGYALVERVWYGDDLLEVSFDEPVRVMAANPRVRADRGRVCVTRGHTVFCAEGIDNGGEVDLELAAEPELRVEGDRIVGRRSDGGELTLIPFAKRCNRGSVDNGDRKMAVWLRQAGLPDEDTLARLAGDGLYFEI
ncbi:MAG: glycoside hydrolase family 127 protein [Clostridia bacterium]|nr:glycoside hydrolase family 127 protein [Clostridia bacterium]